MVSRQRMDPETGALFWPSWSTQQREQLNLCLAELSHQIGVGRSFAAVAVELRRLADTADICAKTLGTYDQVDVLDGIADTIREIG